MYTIHTTHRQSKHYTSARKAERAAQAADVIRIEKDDPKEPYGFRIIDQVELSRDAADEEEPVRCADYDRGAYHARMSR